MRAAVLLAVALLSGCACFRAAPAPIAVKVPVPVRATPPDELLSCTEHLPLPAFEACPGRGAAWSCLPPAQEDAFRAMVHHLLSCTRAWRAWAQPGDPPP